LAILQAVFAMCQVGISHTNTNKVRGFVYMSLANVISGLVNHLYNKTLLRQILDSRRSLVFASKQKEPLRALYSNPAFVFTARRGSLAKTGFTPTDFSVDPNTVSTSDALMIPAYL